MKQFKTRMLRLSFLLFFTLFLTSVTAKEISEKRLALIIGNDDYFFSPLENPVNDAKAIEAKLQEMGFETELLLNESPENTNESVLRFSEKLKSADVGLFYYAGHAIQNQSNNYLISTKAEIKSLNDVLTSSLSIYDVLGKMEIAGNRTSIIILDACRNNPFSKDELSGEAGLAPLHAFGGSLIAYATSPGNVASDGSDDNGLYTQYLLKYLSEKDIPVERIFKSVRKNVIADSDGMQVPWENSSLIDEFYFVKSSDKNWLYNQENSDHQMWDAVLKNPSRLMYQSYIEKFPNGDFHKIALNALQEMGNGTIEIQSNVFGDAIKVNGKYRGSSKLSLSLPPGSYSIEVSKKDFQKDTRDIEIKAGKIVRLSAALKPVGPDIQIASRNLDSFARFTEEEEKMPLLYANKLEQKSDDISFLYKRDPRNNESRNIVSQQSTSKLDPVSGMRFVKVNADCFLMGSPVVEEARLNDENQHKVCISKDYWISQFETTQKQWTKIMGKNPSFFQSCGEQCPVEQISWDDAQKFAEKLSGMTGFVYRLPSEAEWEMAVRAGTLEANYNGDAFLEAENNVPQLDEIAWYSGNSGVEYKGGKYCEDWNEKQDFDNVRCGTRPVGLKKPNALGIFDGIGNVWEWTLDSYKPHSTKQQNDPLESNESQLRVVKGGNWSDSLSQNRSAARYAFKHSEKQPHIGFRLVIQD